ncbi:MAG TPA: hypothetical protein ENH30_01420 [Nitrospirae bacterium]|nr:hypothetical protein [Nitrospirota bacterium]
MPKGKITGEIKTGRVLIDGIELKPKYSLKIRNHSPTGFSWGYAGSGPAQLALAIMLEYLPPEKATLLYQDFKAEVIANIQGDFSIDIDTVIGWIFWRGEVLN